MTSIDLAPLTWLSKDQADEDEVPVHLITAFGRLADGRSASLTLPWSPRFFVDVEDMSGVQRAALLERFPKRHEELCGLVRRTDIMGYNGGRSSAFLRLAFPTLSACRRARDRLQGENRQTYESSVDTVAQFLHAADILPASWIRVAGFRVEVGEGRQFTTDLELTVASARSVSRAADAGMPTPSWSLASWDLETYSPDGRFPSPDKEDCPIIQIGVVFRRYRQPGSRRVVITAAPCDPVPGVELVVTGSEAEMLVAFAALVAEQQVDVLLAWNGFGFDNNYLFIRASRLDIEDRMHLGKCRGDALAVRTLDLAKRPSTLLKVPGLLQYDPMVHLRSENRFDKYSLNHVAGIVVGESKADLPYQEMFRLHASGGSAGQARIADYCCRDCDLPLMIMDKLALLPNVLALANATRTPAEAIITRGQVRPRPPVQPCPVLRRRLPGQQVPREVGRRPRVRVLVLLRRLADLYDVPQHARELGPERHGLRHHRLHGLLPHLLRDAVVRQHEGAHGVLHRRHEGLGHEPAVVAADPPDVGVQHDRRRALTCKLLRRASASTTSWCSRHTAWATWCPTWTGSSRAANTWAPPSWMPSSAATSSPSSRWTMPAWCASPRARLSPLRPAVC